jgi:hypothetical protein
LDAEQVQAVPQVHGSGQVHSGPQGQIGPHGHTLGFVILILLWSGGYVRTLMLTAA